MSYYVYAPFFSEVKLNLRVIVEAFRDGFENGTGKIGACNIVNLLLSGDMCALPIGGPSRYTRRFTFHYSIVESGEDLSDRSDPNKPTSILSTDKEKNFFFPDGIVVKNAPNGQFYEAMIIEVRSKAFSRDDYTQIYFQMLPLLFKQNTVLGLLISSTDAAVIKMSVMEHPNTGRMIATYAYTYCLYPDVKNGLIELCTDLNTLIQQYGHPI